MITRESQRVIAVVLLYGTIPTTGNRYFTLKSNKHKTQKTGMQRDNRDLADTM